MSAAQAPAERDAVELYEALTNLVRVYQFRDRDKICCHDISVTQCYALEALVRTGPSTLNRLAAELYVDKSTASRVVATLLRKKYLGRRPHPDDARATLIEVTPRGRELYQQIKCDLVDEQADLMQDLDPEARRGAITLIRRLTASVAARSGVSCSVSHCAPVGCAP